MVMQWKYNVGHKNAWMNMNVNFDEQQIQKNL